MCRSALIWKKRALQTLLMCLLYVMFLSSVTPKLLMLSDTQWLAYLQLSQPNACSMIELSAETQRFQPHICLGLVSANFGVANHKQLGCMLSGYQLMKKCSCPRQGIVVCHLYTDENANRTMLGHHRGVTIREKTALVPSKNPEALQRCN